MKPSPFGPRWFSSPAAKKPPPAATITAGDLTEINLLVPRLLDAGRQSEATRLVVTSLLLRPPLPSLPLPLLVRRLAAHPATAPAFALLTALRRAGPHCHYALPSAYRILAAAYLRDRRLKDALKVFDHMSRLRGVVAGLPGEEDYGAMIRGIAGGGGRAEEVMRVFGKMVGDGVAVAPAVRERVVGCLLREARVREAEELEQALVRAGNGGDGGWVTVREMVERILQGSDWRP